MPSHFNFLLLINQLLALFIVFPILTSATILEYPDCSPVWGAPDYNKCKEALDAFVHTVTVVRGYSLDERIEFRPNRWRSPPQELPSEWLDSSLYTFMSNDGWGSEGEACVITIHPFFPTVPLSRRNDYPVISTYGEINASISDILESCVKVPAPIGSGGLALISTTDGEEISIQSFVSLAYNPKAQIEPAALQSSLFKGEKLLGGNPWVQGGPDPYGGLLDRDPRWMAVERSDRCAYCNARIGGNCWQGFRCDLISLVDGLKGVLWGLELGRVAEFVGYCVLDGNGS
ncbi:MAG: hypothetical protein M1812_005767 [Candelaria pacifica]|nr:MAG: hypothetical protein M1812_005767 [Candelaria pacifica]